MTLIENKINLWGGYNCLQLAAQSTRRKFISSVACQNSLHFAWCHGIRSNFLLTILTWFIPVLVKFNCVHNWENKRLCDSNDVNDDDDGNVENDEDAEDDDDDDEKNSIGNSISNRQKIDKELDYLHDCSIGINSNRNLSNVQIREPTFGEKLIIFYTAPKTKFCLNGVNKFDIGLY